jgi:ABC-2 type transport system permease protein
LNFLRHSLYCLLRQMRISRRLPAALSLSLVQPLVWMVLFGYLFQSVATIRGFEATSYIQFLAPGIALMSAVFSSGYSGMGILSDMNSGLLDKFLATPVSRGAILVGPVLQTGLQSAVQAVVIVLTALCLGSRPHGGITGVLLLLFIAALLGSAFAAISNAVALVTRRQQTLIATVNLISLPLVFVSSMMMSHRLMPRWMQGIAAVNPVDWAVTAGRATFEGRPLGEVLPPIGLLAVFALLVWTLAARCFALYQRSL